MANEFDLQLGAPAAGWNVYFVLFSGGFVWDGSAFNLDTTANRNAGAIAATEIGTAHFFADMPAGVTESGVYPVIGYRRLGGSPSVATDTVVTYDGSTVEFISSISGAGVHSAAEVIQQLLIDLGLGTTWDGVLEWPTYFGNEPDLPDDAITCYDTQGTEDALTQPTGEQYMHSGVQIMVRSSKHGRGFVKANAIRDALCRSELALRAFVDVEQARYLVHSVVPKGDVLPIGSDSPSSKRVMFTLNLTTAIEPVN